MTLAVEVMLATLEHKTAIGRLLELYQYDFTEFTGEDVDEQGSYGYRYLDQYWTDADRHAFLFRCDGNIAGFAFVQSGTPHDMAEFFVMRKYRGSGVAVAAARSVFARFPGEWQVREVAANKRATAFWRNAIPVPFTEDANDKGPVQHFHIAEKGEGAANAVETFSTARLRAERVTAEHADYLAVFDRDPEVMAWLGGVRTAEESAEWLRKNLEHWEANGFGQWMFRDSTNQLVGRGGLRWIDPSVGEELVEVGYAFQRSAWGAGFATEATTGVIEVARDRYGMQQLGAITLETNTASIRVLTKCGFVYERQVLHPAGAHRFFRLRL